MLICQECLMRHRVEAMMTTGADAPLTVETLERAQPPILGAVTVVGGIALCMPHYAECVKPELSSGLVDAAGSRLLLSQIAAARG